MNNYKLQILMGGLFCLIASIAWGAMFPVASVALQKIDPYYFSVIRYGTVSVILIVVLVLKEGFRALHLEGRGGWLVLYGTMAFTVYNLLVFAGQKWLGDPGTLVASLGEASMPMIAVLLLWMGRKGRPAGGTLFYMIVSLVGAVLVITNGDVRFLASLNEQMVPLLMIFIGMVGWVVYTNGGSRFADWSILRYSALTCALGTLVSAMIVLSSTAAGWLPFPTLETVISIRWEMSFMVFVAGLIALLSWNWGIKLLTPINGLLFINIVPVTTLLIMAVQGYKISFYEYAGIALVLFGLVANNMYQRRQLPQNVNVEAPLEERQIQVKDHSSYVSDTSERINVRDKADNKTVAI